MRTLKFTFLLVVSILSLTSCRVDPEEILVGRWQHSYKDDFSRLHSFTWEINEDGTFKLINDRRPDKPENGKWNFDPSGRKFSIERENSKIQNYNIKSIAKHYVYMTRRVHRGRYISSGKVHLKRIE